MGAARLALPLILGLAACEAVLRARAFVPQPPILRRASTHRRATRPLELSGERLAQRADGSDVGGTADCEGGLQAKQLLVVVLVGIPGSGKSTFADHLLHGDVGEDNQGELCSALHSGRCKATALSPPSGGNCVHDMRDEGKTTPHLLVGDWSNQWTRISQDVLGSRQRCISSARAALRSGRHVLIDRCNFDVHQRTHWVELGRSDQLVADLGGRVRHVAVFLDVPPAVALKRVLKRPKHEGKVDSASMSKSELRQIVRRFSSMLVPPEESEGFDRVLVCTSRKGSQIVATALRTVVKSLDAGLGLGSMSQVSRQLAAEAAAVAAATDAGMDGELARNDDVRNERLLIDD